MNKTKTAIKQLKQLGQIVPNNLRLAADWHARWQILISTILSAQTKDETTIAVSNNLYKKYKSPKHLANAPLKEIKKIIKPINFYKTKAKHIKETARIISEKGIPKTRAKLMKLSGVGYKVSNVYLAVAHKKQCIGVDTHVARLSQKLDWTKNKNKYKIEKDLEKLFPKKYWRSINYVLVRFGRIYGSSRKREDAILKKIRPSSMTPVAV